ncbi:hypothetical protein DAI22_11g131100 [Oryza sativa Japonica Group]|nr:hypothetical protein DAI22_11g131100 [Oryza sativa Japonica Group]
MCVHHHQHVFSKASNCWCPTLKIRFTQRPRLSTGASICTEKSCELVHLCDRCSGLDFSFFINSCTCDWTSMETTIIHLVIFICLYIIIRYSLVADSAVYLFLQTTSRVVCCCFY